MRLIVSPEVVPLQSFAPGVLADVIRRQPPSSARTAFAWELAVGAGMARSTSVEVIDRILIVRARDASWAREVQRAADVILQRMQHVLGPAAIARLEVAPVR